MNFVPAFRSGSQSWPDSLCEITGGYSLHHRYDDTTILQKQRKGNLSHGERIDIDHDVRPTRQALAAQKILNGAQIAGFY